MSDAQNRSFSICCSQKTLPLAIAIWSAHFTQDFPTALIATMIYHLIQIYLDSFIAQKWAQKKLSSWKEILLLYFKDIILKIKEQ